MYIICSEWRLSNELIDVWLYTAYESRYYSTTYRVHDKLFNTQNVYDLSCIHPRFILVGFVLLDLLFYVYAL